MILNAALKYKSLVSYSTEKKDSKRIPRLEVKISKAANNKLLARLAKLARIYVKCNLKQNLVCGNLQNKWRSGWCKTTGKELLFSDMKPTCKSALTVNVNSRKPVKKKKIKTFPMRGIFKRGVMAGALVLLMLNRLQMLKESRGQQSPDREGKRRRGKVSTRQTPRGDITVRRVTSVSFFQHRITSLLSPLPPGDVSKPFLAASLPITPPSSYQYHIS